MEKRCGNPVPYGLPLQELLLDDGVKALLPENNRLPLEVSCLAVTVVLDATTGNEAFQSRIVVDAKEACMSAFAGAVDELDHDVRSRQGEIGLERRQYRQHTRPSHERILASAHRSEGPRMDVVDQEPASVSRVDGQTVGQQEVAASACPVGHVADEPIPLDGSAAGRRDQVRERSQLNQLGETSSLIVLDGVDDGRVRASEDQMGRFPIQLEAQSVCLYGDAVGDGGSDFSP